MNLFRIFEKKEPGRMTFDEAMSLYRDKHIGLKDVKKDWRGRDTGVFLYAGTEKDVLERLGKEQSVGAYLYGANVNCNIMGGFGVTEE